MINAVRSIRSLMLLLTTMLLTQVGWGQISIPNVSAVTQNFSGLSTTTAATLPTGWKCSAQGTGGSAGWSTAANATATTAQASSGNPTAGGIYNWGSSSTERALGFMTSGSYASPNSIMAYYQNNTGSTISSLAISFDYERYRINSAAASVTFFTSSDGSTWVSATDGDSGPFTTGTSSYTFVGGTIVSKSFSINGLSIVNGGAIYLRWLFNTTGSNSQGIGLDNVSVTATIASATPTITGTSTATAFTTTYGSASAPQEFSVSGSDLTANLVATAPSGFEVSSNGGATYSSTASFTQSGGSASGTLRVRLAATAAVGGSYNAQSIVLSSTGATSVNITTAASGNTVSAKALTITANDVSKTAGVALTGGSGSTAFTSSGLENSETIGSVTISYGPAGDATGDGATPGVYANQVTPSVATDGTFTASNYDISYVAGSITVNAAPSTPTISANGILSTVSTTYGTASSPTSFTVEGVALTEGILITPPSGFEVSQTVGGGSGYATTQTLAPTSGTVSSTTVYIRLKADAAVVGSYNSQNVVLTSSGATTVNFPTASSGNSVTAISLTITGLSAADKGYDGTTSVSVTGTPQFSGLVNGESFSVSGSVSWVFPDANVGANKALTRTGNYDAPSTNYTVTQPSLTADIATKELTITGTTIASKVYDGSAVSGLVTPGTLSGFVGAETVTVASATGLFANANAGADKIATITYLLADGTGGGLASNYSLAGTAIGDIEKAPQSITFNALNAKTTADASFTLTATSATSSTNAISYTSSNTSVATISGNTATILGPGLTIITAYQSESDNYLSAEAGQPLTVYFAIAKWSFENVSTVNTNATSPSVGVGETFGADGGAQVAQTEFSGLHASAASDWSNPVGNGSLKSLSVNTWSVGDYFQFKVNTTNYIALRVFFDQTGSSTGPRDFKLQYSTDGLSYTDYVDYSIPVDNSGATPSPYNWSSSSATSPSTKTFNLASLTILNNKSSIYFRLVCNGTTSISGGTVGTGGASRIDNFTITGLQDASAPLPISLLSFSGYKDVIHNQLRWVTVQEVNNSGFEVQRSADGQNYQSIGFVNSQATGGNSQSQLKYTFTDVNPTGIKQYYRLRQFDIDGRSTLSNILLIQGEKPTSLEIASVYPNPARSLVTLLLNAPDNRSVKIQLVDLAGRILQTRQVNVLAGNNSIPFDLSALAKGQYLISVNGKGVKVVRE